MNKERFFWVVVSLLLLIGLLVLVKIHLESVKTPSIEKEQGGFSLPIETVQLQPVTMTRPYIGRIKAIQSVDILPFINGFISQVKVKGGQFVQEGDILFTIDKKTYQAQKDQADAQVLSAKATYDNAAIYLKRIEKTPSKAISQTELDNAKAQFLSAEGSLKAAQAAAAAALVNYNYTEVKAPISGVVGNIPVTIGDYVSPAGKVLAQIIQQTPIRVAFSISNKEYLNFLSSDNNKLFDGWRIQLKLPNNELYPQEGTVVYTDNSVAQDTSSITVYADFDNPNGQLVADGYVDVLAQKNIQSGILIDKDLVHFEPTGSFVYVLNGHKINKQAVSIGITVGQQFYIEKGLKGGESLVKGSIPGDLVTSQPQSLQEVQKK